jgi:hypothetical protein
MIEVSDVGAIVVFSREPRRLAAWYRGAFAARPITESEGFVGLRLGRISLFVQQVSEGHAPGMGGVRPHLTVADCRAAYDALLKAGARSILPVTDVGGEWVAAVRDPEGNPLGLLSFK